MKTITVNASTSYEVFIGENLINQAGEQIKRNGINGKLCIITDKNVHLLYSEKVITSLKNSGFEVYEYVVQGGEESKSGVEFLSILEYLAENEFTRSDCLVALGGGIVGDLTGFVAACYLRGIKFVQIPTTLLAFVDSSVGGKTAINLKAGKNLVGAFYQPSLVICDINTAKTLPKIEYSCGMAEIIKYGMIFDNELLRLLKNGTDDALEEIIYRCVNWKRTVVEKDEFDNGDRQLLNFGHTLGHAIEKQSGYAIPHGQAVGIGMRLITSFAVNGGVCSLEVLTVLDELLDKYGLQKTCNIPTTALIESTLVDKKRKGNHITLVIPQKLGACTLNKMEISKWKEFANN